MKKSCSDGWPTDKSYKQRTFKKFPLKQWRQKKSDGESKIKGLANARKHDDF